MPAGVCDFEPSILCQSWVCFIAQVIQILLISWPSAEVCVCVCLYLQASSLALEYQGDAAVV